MSSTIHISEPNLRHNVAAARRILGGTELLAVIKADAYGHSAPLVAPLFARAGISWLGVTNAEEGVKVRTALNLHGFDSNTRILIMTAPPGDPREARVAATLALTHSLVPTISAADQFAPLAEAAATAPPLYTLPFHLEIDTGMSRQGIPPAQRLHDLLVILKQYPKLRLNGICTHLASAECIDALQSLDQLAAFDQACAQVRDAETVLPPWIHVGNTSMLDNASPAAAPLLVRLARRTGPISQPMSRSGLGLYGYSLPLDPNSPHEARLRHRLHPILTWTTTITSIEDVPPGAEIGYSATYIAPRPMRLALLPVGYADGLRRGLSSTNDTPGGWVFINNQKAPILGRISMNLTTVDVTHIDCAPGTPATLLGPGITAEDHARLANCLPYEILCGLRATKYAVLPDGPAAREAVTS